MRALLILSMLIAMTVLGGCSARSNGVDTAMSGPATATAEQTRDVALEGNDSDLTIVVAPAVSGRVDEALLRAAFHRAVAQGERDFGMRLDRSVTLYVDPDSAIGLEDALGLSARYVIHLRAGRAQRMDSLLPLMMHEYTHVLQYDVGRLRPQWWIEGQAEHQSQRVLDPARAARERRTLLSSLAGDVRGGRAPALATLRGSTGWDEYIKRSGAGKAYGWGHAAVAFIEDGWGFDAVTRIMRDSEGPNTLGSFDEAVRRETSLDPAQFEQGLRAWLLKQG